MSNFQNTCRLCGKESDFRLHIFDSSPEYLAKIEAVVPDVVILQYDGLPKHVCHRCVAKVKEFYEFRSTCIQTQEDFKKKLPWMSSRESERSSYASKSPLVTYIGGPLAYPYGSKTPEVEVLTLSDDEDEEGSRAFPKSTNLSALAEHPYPEGAPKGVTANHSNNGSQNINSQLSKSTHPVRNQEKLISSSPSTVLNKLNSDPVIQSNGPIQSKLVKSEKTLPPRESIIKRVDSLPVMRPKSKPKPKPKCKKRPHELEQTETDYLQIQNTYPAVDFIQICENQLIFTCKQCNQILVTEDAISAHQCVTGSNNESTYSFSNKNEDSNHSSSSSVELIISDDETSDCRLTPKHCCATCGQLFHNIGRLRKHEQCHL